MTTPLGPGGSPPPGWYADPAGAPGRVRFWDGTRWTDRTRSSSTSTNPTSPHSSSTDPSGPKKPRRWLGLLALLVVVVLVATVLLVRQRPGDVVEDPLPTSTVVGGDDSSPTPTPPSTSPAPSASSTPSADSDPGDTSTATGPSARPVECDASRTDTLPAPATDGRVHGGPLSFARIDSPWFGPSATPRFPFSSDSYVQILRLDEELPWQASAQVGLAVFDDYPGSRTAAQTMLTCLLTCSFYTTVDVTLAENTTKATTVAGTKATQVDAALTFQHPQLKTTGSAVRIIVVETDPVTYFFSAEPGERADLMIEIDRATRSLTVS